MTAVEFVTWFSFLFITSVGISHQIIGPLAEAAQAQAALNEESLLLIQEVRSGCGTPL
jgi:hypothetical protein